MRLINKYYKILFVLLLSISIFFIFIKYVYLDNNDIKHSTKCKYHFAIIGDRTGGMTFGIYRDIIKEINNLCPDFLINIGDMIDGYLNDTDLLNKQWKEFIQIEKLISVPNYYTTGNHDITPHFEKTMFPIFNKYRNKGTQYTFTYLNTYFIVYDTSIWEDYNELPESQWEWLNDKLKNAPKLTNIFVFMHRPYWINYIANNKKDKMHELFVKYKVTAVFTGHYHRYSSAKIDNIIYTSVGSSGGWVPYGEAEDEGFFYHYVWCTVEDDKIKIAPIKYKSVKEWDFLTESDYQLIKDLKTNSINFNNIEYNSNSINNSNLSLILNNIKNKNIKNIKLNWVINNNWNVEPTKKDITINDADIIKLNFKINQKFSLYPLPLLNVNILKNNRNIQM